MPCIYQNLLHPPGNDSRSGTASPQFAPIVLNRQGSTHGSRSSGSYTKISPSHSGYAWADAEAADLTSTCDKPTKTSCCLCSDKATSVEASSSECAVSPANMMVGSSGPVLGTHTEGVSQQEHNETHDEYQGNTLHDEPPAHAAIKYVQSPLFSVCYM